MLSCVRCSKAEATILPSAHVRGFRSEPYTHPARGKRANKARSSGMFRLLSYQVFHEPPAPSIIASVLKPKVGQTKRFCKIQLGGRQSEVVYDRAARYFGRVAGSARNNSTISFRDDRSSCSPSRVGGCSLLLPRRFGVCVGAALDVHNGCVRLLSLRGIRRGVSGRG